MLKIVFILSLDKIVEITFLSSPTHWYTLPTCPAKSGGLGGPPPMRELSMLCPLIQRERSHWGRPPMTHSSEMLCKKINYRLNRPKLDNVSVRCGPDRIGLLGKPSAAQHRYLQDPVAVLASQRSSYLQCGYEAIRVWSYTTFIV